MLLLGSMVVAILVLLAAAAAGRASAASFCSGAVLKSGQACEGAFGVYSFVEAEVTSGSSTICVALKEGSVKFGKRCGFNRASANLSGSQQGHPWVFNEGASTVTVTGFAL